MCYYYRTSDAEMVANYRVQAELTAVESTPDGKALVLGTIDGCVSVLAIVDPIKNEMNEFIAEMPSRDEEVSNYLCLMVIAIALSKNHCYSLLNNVYQNLNIFEKYNCKH